MKTLAFWVSLVVAMMANVVFAESAKPAPTKVAPLAATSDKANDKPAVGIVAKPAPAKENPLPVANDAKGDEKTVKVDTKDKAEDTVYDPKNYIGVAVTDATGKLQYVAENISQTHSKENFVMVRVKGIKARGDKEKGRVRIAVWDGPANYAKEGTKPFRASSHWAKESQNGEMVFRIAGLEKGKSYSFFAHFDKENRGYVKKVLGIPTDPFLFTNAKNQGTGPGLTREGLSPPKFESTLVKFNNPGQEIVMEF